MSEQKAARIAFIGAGVQANQSLYPNIGHIPEFDFVAVCDLIEEKARLAARKWGALEWYTDMHNMIDKVQPDGICVCGPAQMHYDVGMEVLRRGIPLFVEKPNAANLDQAEEMVKTARAHKTWGMVAFMKRFAPSNVVAKEVIQSPEFGQLNSINLIHGCGPYDDKRRMLYFNGIHLIDLGRFLAGDVTEVFAYTYSNGKNRQAVSATMRYANGAVGQLNMNSGQGWSDCFEQAYVSGDGTAIVLDASRATEVMSETRRFAEGKGYNTFGWSSRYYVSGNMAGWQAGSHYTRGYWGELSHFARAVAGLVPPTSTLEDGLADIRAIEAMLESAKTGQPVKVAPVV